MLTKGLRIRSIKGPTSVGMVITVIALVLSSGPVISKCSAQATDGPSTAAQLGVNRGNPANLNGNIPEGFRTDSNSLVKASALHSVKLSWNPSVPATKSARDAIVGYIVYRSTKPHDPNATPINSTRITDTTFVDHHVEPGKVYYYVTRAVNASGALSAPSNEVRADIPR